MAESRGIDVALKEELVKVDHSKKIATFENTISRKQTNLDVRTIRVFNDEK